MFFNDYYNAFLKSENYLKIKDEIKETPESKSFSSDGQEQSQTVEQRHKNLKSMFYIIVFGSFLIILIALIMIIFQFVKLKQNKDAKVNLYSPFIVMLLGVFILLLGCDFYYSHIDVENKEFLDQYYFNPSAPSINKMLRCKLFNILVDYDYSFTSLTEINSKFENILTGLVFITSDNSDTLKISNSLFLHRDPLSINDHKETILDKAYYKIFKLERDIHPIFGYEVNYYFNQAENSYTNFEGHYDCVSFSYFVDINNQLIENKTHNVSTIKILRSTLKTTANITNDLLYKIFGFEFDDFKSNIDDKYISICYLDKFFQDDSLKPDQYIVDNELDEYSKSILPITYIIDTLKDLNSINELLSSSEAKFIEKAKREEEEKNKIDPNTKEGKKLLKLQAKQKKLEEKKNKQISKDSILTSPNDLLSLNDSIQSDSKSNDDNVTIESNEDLNSCDVSSENGIDISNSTNSSKVSNIVKNDQNICLNNEDNQNTLSNLEKQNTTDSTSNSIDNKTDGESSKQPDQLDSNAVQFANKDEIGDAKVKTTKKDTNSSKNKTTNPNTSKALGNDLNKVSKNKASTNKTSKKSTSTKPTTSKKQSVSQPKDK